MNFGREKIDKLIKAVKEVEVDWMDNFLSNQDNVTQIRRIINECIDDLDSMWLGSKKKEIKNRLESAIALCDVELF